MLLTAYDPFPNNIETPYRASSPIFVHADNNRCERFDGGALPECHKDRPFAIRAYDGKLHLVGCDLVSGGEVEEVAGRMLDNKGEGKVSVLVYNARQGCFAFGVERA